MMRRVSWVGAGAAAAVRLVQRADRARREPPSNGNRLTVRATVAPELVADLTDLLRRVTGRAEREHSGAISVSLAPGVDRSGLERELRAVLDRWSEMHPGVRVRVTVDAEARPRRRMAFRRASDSQERKEAATVGTVAGPQ
jgi:hypothetical protein